MNIEDLLQQRADLERQAEQNGFDVALAIEEFAGAVAKYGDGSPEAQAAEAKADALFDAGEVLVERLAAISGLRTEGSVKRPGSGAPVASMEAR